MPLHAASALILSFLVFSTTTMVLKQTEKGSSLGLFSEPAYVSVGDKYQDRKGRQASTSCVRSHSYVSSRNRSIKASRTSDGHEPGEGGKDTRRVFLEITSNSGTCMLYCLKLRVLTVCQGTPYVEPAIADRKYEAAKKKKNITDKPFRPTSPPKQAYVCAVPRIRN